MRLRDIPRLACLFGLLLCCVACADVGNGNLNVADASMPNAVSSTTPTATPPPTPVPLPTETEVATAFLEILCSIPVAVDLSAEIEEMALPERPIFSDIRARHADFSALSLEYYIAVSSASEDAIMQLEDLLSDLVLEYDMEIEVPDWKYLGSVLWAVEDTFSAWDMLDVNCAVETSAGGRYLLSIDIAPADFQPFLYSLAGDDRDLYMDARYIMTYLTTVFDAEGEEIDYVMPVLSDDYIATIQKPLEKTSYYDSWYQGRSNNTRKHTGLDMRAPANSEIRSCTDGTVLYIGYQATPGNYVVILDDEGYEYHYYHMIRQTDFLQEGQRVSAGDLIGHVGNTGNSAVNHLHLSLITPDSVFVKLFDLMNALYSKR